MKDILMVLLSVSTAFILERLWDYYKTKKNAQAHFNDLLDQVVIEIDYNCESGIGSAQCPFKLNSHDELAKHKLLNQNIRQSLNSVINAALKCNAYGRERSLELKPGNVKSMSRDLKQMLLKLQKGDSH